MKVSLYDPDRLLSLLQASSAVLTGGLTTDEFDDIETRYGISFGPDHRELLSLAVPTGNGWVDWRHDDETGVRGRLEWPLDGVLYDVQNNAFWPSSWGQRPSDEVDAQALARRHMEQVPKLLPVYVHRYLPAGPCEPRLPVFSVYQTDTTYYGRDLEDYLVSEFSSPTRGPVEGRPKYAYFWSELAEGREDEL